jgi:multidrug efflux pump subunit AcrA (membrane-fusion protein)
VTAAAAFLAGAAFVGVELAGMDFGAAQTASPQGLQAQGLQAQGSRTQVAQVVVVRAKNACFSSMIRVTGFLVARQEAIVSLDVPGLRVTEVLANEGDKVTAGQTLVRLARQSAEGPQPPGGSLTALRAPAAGVVTRSTASIGATAPAGPAEPLFRIAVDSEIELEAEIPSVHVPELAAGQPARVEIDGNRDVSGRVRLVPAAIDRRTQLGRARLSLDRDPALKLGTFARATIEANRSCGVSVPGSAVLYRTGGASVQVVREDVVERHTVQVGLRSDTDIEIREGVRDGDLVVANAGSSLRDGDKVRPVVADKAP